ncbi:uncharacterized protein MONOS_9274 [Monocercomonoides exilis]|uniref:uncharacterized protein n=1 Tax=Monocercomonoides exilis TaxID=2049356 RepID=UPI0035593D5F|nr:hypothetical protein MONOS_9274 [Monocercomonoides exilis]|eukprot:MONOS_9274.1-p1 / transcript=MONOS_9274.1 / gene=MONOS_9274 / organism=Monocercomonoides_exilis_PA203 / gene_product=unspecified product / transcript_product=unspecified product / location=Mono_scaffold00376:37750-40663(-) / protein_length=539 / sequence_SO=supercontig / SO=protein_coding / is_pseudo=false
MKLEQIESTRYVVEIGQCGSVVPNGIDADGVKLSEGCIISIDSSTSVTNYSLVMKDVIISDASSGGLSASAGKVTIEKGEFLSNNTYIEKYPSLHRNIICSDFASLTISSLKGGDGVKDNSSFWHLNDGCTFDGIAGERASPFFIPKLEDLREIVNDTVKKDPKAFEMITMEMSPEDQWRRAEREAEKKNEERIKKRMNGKEMQYSESEEYLLSENGSTEYILGRDSDKIPEWALEKADEKEEDTRKRTPSPSISSTSTTDSDSTFVRGEDTCPTTSSMSNLVDPMACSSPHEKLIVDLRDSMFMLLHGRNEKKEMAIGSLKEREMTAAQILPHVVLFSEHMVICIALHSDCSSDDSDSSSISSTTTIATSSSDCSCANRNGRGSPPPSSAFEDEDDFRKECMRWKAPELLSGAKRHATKKTVVFSIGMMVWECLTLQIPFGEYEAETAGQKIVNHEQPNMSSLKESNFFEIVRACLSAQPQDRLSLAGLKREFILHLPLGAAILTMSDTIDLEETTEDGEHTTSVNSSDIAGTFHSEK